MKKSSKLLAVLLAVLVAVGAFFLGKQVAQQDARSERADFSAVVAALDFDGETYVIGHRNPDTDTVCSAIVCARLFQEVWSIDCVPAVGGKVNNETRFVLDYFGVEVPALLDDASGKRIIAVDHSDSAQAIDGMRNAKILALFAHHGLGDLRTEAPPLIEVAPVGSTATVVYAVYRENSVTIDKSTAGLIVSCILSDTVNLTSTTTTDLDKSAVKALASVAGISDVDAYYQKMEEAADSYDGMTNTEILNADYKEYSMSGTAVGISCVNATDAEAANAMKLAMAEAMEELYPDQQVEHLYVLILNKADNESVVVCYGSGARDVLQEAFGSAEPVFRPAAVRKKDFVPQLEAAYKSRGEAA